MTTDSARVEAQSALHRITAAMASMPRGVFAAVATTPAGCLAERAEGVQILQGALARGETPAVNVAPWPTAAIQAALFAWLTESGLARRCAKSPELAVEVTLSVLDIVSRAEQFTEQEFHRILEELRAREDARSNSEPLPRALDHDRRNCATQEEVSARRQAEEAATTRAMDDLSDEWSERLSAWSVIEAVFGEIGTMCGLGWDLSRSVLHHAGWRDAQRLADLLKQLPQLQELVRTLGRMQSAKDHDETPIFERLFGPVRRSPTDRRDIITPTVPHDTRGVERSGEIARMLPSEAILFIRPALRLLWHAKRAERALATYHVRGVDEERLIADQSGREAQETSRKRPLLQRGPIIVCLDTSGSMMGAPELVAKAITLEAVRVAKAEKRECLLYSFSGPSEVAEFDLTNARSGIQSLLEFLGCSFHGGTEVSEPLRRALQRIETARWAAADIIIVSDGEWPPLNPTVTSVALARKRMGLRIHGLLIGAEGSAAMTALCEPVHLFRDWNALNQLRFS